MSLPIDHQSRLAALDPQRSICVTAPAGSGKTELLSQRVLKLLSSVDQPEEILAITFTRKAAAEMHHRIIAALQFARSQEKPAEPHKLLTWQLAHEALARDEQCGWHLLDNTSRLKIQTIDSLCASLTRQMPILSNFGAQPAITDQAQTHYRSAIHQLLQKLESDTGIAKDLAVLLEHVDNDMTRLERLLMSLLSRRDQWLSHISLGGEPEQAREVIERTLRQIIVDVLTALKQTLADFSAELLPLLDYAGCNCQHQKPDSLIARLAGIIELPDASPEAVQDWLAIADTLLTAKHTFRKRVDIKSGFPTETIDGDKALAKRLKAEFVELLGSIEQAEELRQHLLELRHLPAPKLPANQWRVLQSLASLLPALVAELMVIFQLEGEVDHSLIAMSALRALGDGLTPSELALKLDYQLSHILVDEFQDTASTQFQLLERLVEGWGEYNQQNPQRPNTLFIVGDGMQSIYSFRQANVGLFLQARHRGVNGVALDDCPLSVNFRSDPLVVEWINSTFINAFPARDNPARGAVRFESANAFNQALNNAEVKLFGFTGDQARLQEAEKVVALTQRALDSEPEGSIAILVRSRGHLADIIPALQAAGIAWHAADIDPLASYGAIRDLLSLTRALTNIADQISWAALMRTPWIGLDNQDLFYLQRAAGKDGLASLFIHNELPAQLSKKAKERLSAVSQLFRTAFQQRQRQTVRSWVEGIWLALGGAAALSSSDEFAMVDDYFNLLESYQNGELLLHMDDFEEAVQRLYARPVNSDCKLSIMTIHKAKGLEFDSVILPSLSRSPRSDDKSLLMWREYTSDHNQFRGLVINTLPAAGEKGDLSYDHLRFEQGQSSQLENTRLFYVAATRAIKRLYVLLTTNLDPKTEEPKPPPANSLIASAWQGLQEQVEWCREASRPGQQQFDFDELLAGEHYWRLPSHWQPPAWSFSNPLEEFYIKGEYDEDEENLPAWSESTIAADIGTACHSLFEILIEKGLSFWSEKTADNKQRWLENLLQLQSVAVSDRPMAVDQLISTVDRVIADDRGQWLLSPNHQLSKTEFSLLSSFTVGVKKKILDRLIIDEEGDFWIVDYKTSSPLAGESKAGFIDRELSQYRVQLMDYRLHLSVFLRSEAFISTAPISPIKEGQSPRIRTALYFTHYPHFEELEI